MGQCEQMYEGILKVTRHVDVKGKEEFFVELKPGMSPINGVLLAGTLLEYSGRAKSFDKDERAALERLVNHIELFVKLHEIP